jgi:hypothetical protein
LALRGERGLTELADGQADLTVSLTSKDGGRLLARLAGRTVELPAELASLDPLVPGELTLRASGVPNGTMTAVLKLTSGGLSASFDGALTAEGEAHKVDGRIDVAASSAAVLLDALGAANSGELDTRLDLKAHIAGTGTSLVIDGIEARIDGAPVSGKVTVATGGPVPDLDIDLTADQVRLAALLAPLVKVEPPVDVVETAVENSTVPAGGEEAALPADETVWSDQPIDLAMLDGWKGRLALQARQLVILEGLALEDSELTASIDPGGFVLETLEGNAAGGNVTAHGALRREAAGVSLSLEAAVADAELEEIFVDRDGRSKAKGTARAQLSLKSTGLTPRGLIAVLEGKGELKIESGQINGLSPVTVDQAARQLLTTDDKVTPEAIGDSISASREAADYPIGTFATPLSVVDGMLRAQQVAISTEQSSLRLKGRLDLDSFRIESDWTLAPKAIESVKPPLPPITIAYGGPLAEIRTLAAEADVAALERELVARKLIGGEEQLEGLWPDAPPRQGASLAPDADRTAPIPADEAIADVPEPEPAASAPRTTGTIKGSVRTRKVKRDVSNTTVILREHEGVNVR